MRLKQTVIPSNAGRKPAYLREVRKHKCIGGQCQREANQFESRPDPLAACRGVTDSLAVDVYSDSISIVWAANQYRAHPFTSSASYTSSVDPAAKTISFLPFLAPMEKCDRAGKIQCNARNSAAVQFDSAPLRRKYRPTVSIFELMGLGLPRWLARSGRERPFSSDQYSENVRDRQLNVFSGTRNE
ncbi:hypothetical protein EVAR_9860_1 [Eumeta japonica]|uniref:Uncharacterized protein n=1 Tax=Eumeta variegata TaxID=151549 RepID=A0A4C1TQ76_EUMVA|nr:hypothetical protein EVAR_9860_1 [Eumeta japonica]